MGTAGGRMSLIGKRLLDEGPDKCDEIWYGRYVPFHRDSSIYMDTYNISLSLSQEHWIPPRF